MRKPVVAAFVGVVAAGTIAATTVGAMAAGGTPRGPRAGVPAVAPPSGDTATITVSPASGKPGTVVTISNSDSCFGGGTTTATVTLHDPAVQTASENDVDGSWSVQITVAAGTPPGTYSVTARCTNADENPEDYDYTANSFTVTGTASPSASPSPSPSASPKPTPSPAAAPATAVKGNAGFTG